MTAQNDPPAPADPPELEEWTRAACAALELDPEPVLAQHRTLLDLARDAAHGVTRPAAPVTTYLLGLAVGSGADPAQAARALSALADGWSPARTGT